MIPTPDLSVVDEERRDVFADRMFGSMLGTLNLLTIYVGHRLGFYDALRDGSFVTSAELAQRTRTDTRQVREWLEQQAAFGILDVEDASARPEERRFHLPAAHAEVLTDEHSLFYLLPFARYAVGLSQPMERLIESFRTGAGVPWAAHGADMREGQAAGNRPAFERLLGTEWLGAVPEIDSRLRADPPARVADFACGAGWSTIAIARAYPKVSVDGIDLDGPALVLARANLEGEPAAIAQRVSFQEADIADPALAASYDLVTIFEALHDLTRPVEALTNIRRLLAADGSVFVGDERTEDVFVAPAPDLERLFYGFSVLCCLPAGLVDEGSAGTGTVFRAATLERYAREAGFSVVDILPIDHDSFRFYRLRP
jgi:SAM-dependent methyltransferase